MRRFARAGNRVLFVNSISMGLPSVGSPDFIAKIKRKLRSYARFVRRAEDGIIVVSPAVIPFYSNHFIRRLNRWLLVLQIRLLMIAFDLRNPILWIAIPTAREVVGRLGECFLVYQVSDKYEANKMDHATGGGVIADMHRELLDRAAIVYYSGRKLFEEERAAAGAPVAVMKLLEQAVDFEHFAAATSSIGLPVPQDIARIPGPRLGYFGAIETWLLDQDLISYVASRRPEWHWVLMGLRSSRLRVEDFPNVHYLGSKRYAELPEYAAQFDVCVLPWVTDNDFVNHGSPIKVREYLATGKPVVITPLYEYERLDGILRIARSYDDFISQVEDALTRDSESRKQARQQSMRDATWDRRAEEVSKDIALLLGEP
jgi:glycosyltransferase involved in cell wall biosynthesis